MEGSDRVKRIFEQRERQKADESSKPQGNHRVSQNLRGSKEEKPSLVSTTLHARTCTICRNPQREEIERDFLAWRSAQEIVRDYKLGSRMAVYRHAHALGLTRRRYGNIRAVLARIMERAGEAPVTAWAVVAAVRACARINASGQWLESAEESAMQGLLDGMTREELEEYALSGTLPEWVGRERPAARELKLVVEGIGEDSQDGPEAPAE